MALPPAPPSRSLTCARPSVRDVDWQGYAYYGAAKGGTRDRHDGRGFSGSAPATSLRSLGARRARGPSPREVGDGTEAPADFTLRHPPRGAAAPPPPASHR